MSEAERGQPSAKHILEARTSRDEPNLSYKLAESQYALDFAGPSEGEIDERDMAFDLLFADGKHRDGVGDLLEVEGIDCSRHRSNPLVLADHGKTVTLPLGLTETRDTKQYTVRIDPVSKQAWAKVYVYQGKSPFPALKKSGEDGVAPYDHALFCEQFFDLWVKRLIRSGSIGYQVTKALPLHQDYERGIPQGLHLLSVLMLECSAVVLPANGDTVRKMLAMPSVCGKPMSPYLIKSLRPYDVSTKTAVSFEGTIETKAKKKPTGSLKPRPTGGDRLVRIKCSKGDLTGKYVQSISDPFGIVNPANSKESAPVRTTDDAYEMLQLHKRKGDHYGLWLEELPEQEYNERGYKHLPGLASPEGEIADGMAEATERMKSLRVRYRKSSPDQDHREGYRARIASKRIDECPHDDPARKTEWERGWKQADEELRASGGKAVKSLRLKYRAKSSRLERIMGMSRWLEWEVEKILGGVGDQGMRLADMVRTINRNPSHYGKITPEEVRHTLDSMEVEEASGKYRRVKSISTKARRSQITVGVDAMSSSMVPGQRVYARRLLIMGGPARPDKPAYTFAKPGDSLVVVEDKRTGGSMKTGSVRVRNREGKEEDVGGHDLRVPQKSAKAILKSPVDEMESLMVGTPGEKSLPDVRKKYRTSRGFVRRLKKSRPGACLVHVARKDLDDAEEMASGKGLKFQRLGSADGVERVKLIGDDSASDEVAKAFGRPMGRKSLEAGDVEPWTVVLTGNGSIVSAGRGADGVVPPKGSRTYTVTAGNRADAIARARAKFNAGEPSEKGTKSMSKYGKKDMEADIPVPEEEIAIDADVPEEIVEEEKGLDEPYGAQVVRRMHEDASLLMKDYDSMMGPLEHAETKSYLEGHLQGLEKHLSGLEKHWAKHYKDLPPLEGAMEADAGEDDPLEEVKDLEDDVEKDMDTMDDNPVPADSEEDEVPSPEEAYEGSIEGEKGLKRKVKSACPECGKQGCSCKKSKSLLVRINKPMIGDRTTAARNLKNSFDKMKASGAVATDEGVELEDTQSNRDLLKRLRYRFEQKFLEKDLPVPHGDLSKTDVPPPAWEPGAGAKGLEPHESAAVGEASGFLKDIAQPDSQFGEEERLKSFHYHKSLKAIADVGDADSLGGDVAAVPGEEIHKSVPGDPDWAGEEAAEPEHKSHRKACKDASEFLGQAARERAFGDPHREKAMAFHKALEEVVNPAAPVEEEPSAEATFEPGEMGEKDIDGEEEQTKRLKSLLIRQRKEMDDIHRKMALLNGHR